MERIKLFTAALLLAAISAGNDVWALSDSRKKDTRPVKSPQFFSGNANPLLVPPPSEFRALCRLSLQR